MAINPSVPAVHKWGPAPPSAGEPPARPGSLRGNLEQLTWRLRRDARLLARQIDASGSDIASEVKANGAAVDLRLKKIGRRLGRALDRIADGVAEGGDGRTMVANEVVDGPLLPVFEALRDHNDPAKINGALRDLRKRLDMGLMQELAAEDLLMVDQVYAQYRELHPVDPQRQRVLRMAEVANASALLRHALDELNARNGSTP